MERPAILSIKIRIWHRHYSHFNSDIIHKDVKLWGYSYLISIGINCCVLEIKHIHGKEGIAKLKLLKIHHSK